jgi:hypothetical protein
MPASVMNRFRRQSMAPSASLFTYHWCTKTWGR